LHTLIGGQHAEKFENHYAKQDGRARDEYACVVRDHGRKCFFGCYEEMTMQKQWITSLVWRNIAQCYSDVISVMTIVDRQGEVERRIARAW